MVGSDGVSILTEELIGGLVDITEDIGMDIIEVTGMALEVGIGQGTERDNATQTEMYITMGGTELNKVVMSEILRLQTILIIEDKLPAKQIICTRTGMGMFTNAIRMAISKTSRTDRGNNPVSDPVSNLQQVNSSVPNQARGKVISGNKWKGPTRIGAPEPRIITGHNNNKEVVAEADPVEEQAEVAVVAEVVAEEDKRIQLKL